MFKSSKEFTLIFLILLLIVKSGKAQNSGYPKLCGVNAGHKRDFHPLADHMTKFSAFSFSLKKILHAKLNNLIVCSLS